MVQVRYAIYMFRLLFLLAGISACVYLFAQFRLSSYFPIHIVRVFGVNHIAQRDLQFSIRPLVARGFFGIRIDQIRNQLLQQPWAEDVFVRRDWPDVVNVTIIEKQAVALWNKELLLSRSGHLYQPARSTYPNDLPNFAGPSGTQAVLLENYYDINRILLPLHAKITSLEMTSDLNWRILLDNGVNLQVGDTDILERVKHLVRVYPSIVGDHAKDVEYIDLRYSNGVAVRWKGAAKTHQTI